MSWLFAFASEQLRSDVADKMKCLYNEVEMEEKEKAICPTCMANQIAPLTTPAAFTAHMVHISNAWDD